MIEITIGALHVGVPLIELGAFLVLTFAGFRYAWNAGASEWDELRIMTHLREGSTHAEIMDAIRKRCS